MISFAIQFSNDSAGWRQGRISTSETSSHWIIALGSCSVRSGCEFCYDNRIACLATCSDNTQSSQGVPPKQFRMIAAPTSPDNRADAIGGPQPKFPPFRHESTGPTQCHARLFRTIASRRASLRALSNRTEVVCTFEPKAAALIDPLRRRPYGPAAGSGGPRSSRGAKS